MRNDRAAPAWRQLFAERQIYLRSGEDSRYVVLSPRLQVVVTIGALLLVAGLGLASYGYLAQRSQLVAQDRERDVAIAAQGGQLRREIEAAVVAEAEQLRAELELADEQIETLGAERDALETRLDDLAATARAGDEEASRLSRQLADAEAEIQRLHESPDSRAPGTGLVGQEIAGVKGPARDESIGLRQDIAGTGAAGDGRVTVALEARFLLAEARIAELEARLAVLAAGLVPTPPPAAPR